MNSVESNKSISILIRELTCPCGEFLIGDGYRVVLHCPYTEQQLDVAPDSNPIFCDFDGAYYV